MELIKKFFDSGSGKIYMENVEILVDIVGKCNAKCRWCVTGIENRKHPQEIPSMNYKNIMELGTFKKIICHLVEQKIMDANTRLTLYNRGEPFLHPHLQEIIEFVDNNDIKYNLSTNGSIPLKGNYPKNAFRNLDLMVVSFPGFSQKSYDKIHGFNIEWIKKNVENIINIMRSKGFQGTMQMSYHCYQFSQNEEMWEAAEYCKRLGIVFVPVTAHIADSKIAIQYLNNTLPYKELKELGQYLNLSYLKDLLNERSSNYVCPRLGNKQIVIDENGDTYPCCAFRDKSLGKFLNCRFEEIIQAKNNAEICQTCQAIKYDYWSNHPMVLDQVQLKRTIMTTLLPTDFKNEKYMIFGSGDIGRYFLKLLKTKHADISCFIDNDLKKIGQRIDNIPIKSLNELKKEDMDKIIIATNTYKTEIELQLRKNGFQERRDFIYYKDFIFEKLLEGKETL
jgi:MoaA/NifB/PqqE/SkfB family radical SAM enzyme